MLLCTKDEKMSTLLLIPQCILGFLRFSPFTCHLLCYNIISSFLCMHVYMFFALPASPVPGVDHYGDDDLPTIPEEVVPDELPSEVHTCTQITKVL